MDRQDNNNALQPTPAQSTALTQRCDAVLQRYGNTTQFAQIFSLEKMDRYVLNPYRCCTGTAPSLTLLSKAYHPDYPIQWLMTIIIGLSEYSGAKVKVTPFQAKRLAYNIYSEYPFLKVTEIMLFFHNVELGYYGQVDWGSFDPINIFRMLPRFMTDRQEQYARQQSEQQERQQAEDRRRAVPCPPDIKASIEKRLAALAGKTHR